MGGLMGLSIAVIGPGVPGSARPPVAAKGALAVVTAAVAVVL
jgi:hypothetical protein